MVVNDAELRPDGTLVGRLRLDAEGAADSRLRRLVYQNRRRALEDLLAAALGHASQAVRITRVTHRVADDFSGGMWVVVEYELPGYALRVGDALEFSPPAAMAVKNHPLLFRAGSERWGRKRTTDVFLYYTQRLDITENIRVPAGYRLAEPPKIDPVHETFGTFESKAGQTGSVLNLHARLEVLRRQIPPSGYAGFKKALDAMDDYAAASFRLVKGGAR